jgi:hypothetical protein
MSGIWLLPERLLQWWRVSPSLYPLYILENPLEAVFRSGVLEMGRVQEQGLEGLGMEIPAMEILERGKEFLANFSMRTEVGMALGPGTLKIRNPSTLRRPKKRDTKEKWS